MITHIGKNRIHYKSKKCGVSIGVIFVISGIYIALHILFSEQQLWPGFLLITDGVSLVFVHFQNDV